MHIVAARHLGFCPGVRRAFQVTEKALGTGQGLVFLLGDLVHNQQAVQSLIALGGIRVDTPEQVEAGSLVITRSHGLERSVEQAIRRQGAHVVDTTCPRVKSVHSLAEKLEKKGYAIAVLGNTAHAEVRALVSYLHYPPLVMGESEQQWEQLPRFLNTVRKPVAVLEQTTFPQSIFQSFVHWMDKQVLSFPVEIHRTLCPETGLRQQELSDRIRNDRLNAVILLGGKHSANTRALSLVAQQARVRVHWIESAEEVQSQWFGENDRVFLTSGASTPDDQVQKTFQRLRAISQDSDHRSPITDH